MKSSDPKDPLDGLLDQWRERTPPLEPGIERDVWHRIRRSQRANQPASWFDRLNAIFARPSFATLFVVGCLLLGLFLAEMKASRLQAAYSAKVTRSYLSLVDPLLAEPSATGTAPAATP